MKYLVSQFISEHNPGSYMLDVARGTLKNFGLDQHLQTEEIDFSGKVAIVTGASSGIGMAIARELARKEALVVLASRNEKKLNALRDQLVRDGGRAIVQPVDVRDEEQCRRLVENTVKLAGGIDILVNNAGISMHANFGEVGMDVMRNVMDTNYWGSVYCTKYALPYLLESQGCITGISSICGITPLPGRSGYAASKHAMDGFMESLRVEHTPKGLHVMLVHPGFTRSNIRYRALDKNGNAQAFSPLDEDQLMSAERVAHEVILGIWNRKKNLILTPEGKLITWIYRRLPNLAERLIYREMNTIK